MSADSFSERPLFGGAISTTFPPTFQEKNYRKGRFCPSKIKGKRCFELGAGCGVAGFDFGGIIYGFQRSFLEGILGMDLGDFEKIQEASSKTFLSSFVSFG
ncbi:hypothetical protein DITRI_Ditri20bG0052700 [Diplodiscus trichospermus]